MRLQKDSKPIEFDGFRLGAKNNRIGVITMDIKEELRLMREYCPDVWEKIKDEKCPDLFHNDLKCYYISGNQCYVGNSCKE